MIRQRKIDIDNVEVDLAHQATKNQLKSLNALIEKNDQSPSKNLREDLLVNNESSSQPNINTIDLKKLKSEISVDTSQTNIDNWKKSLSFNDNSNNEN